MQAGQTPADVLDFLRRLPTINDRGAKRKTETLKKETVANL